MFVGLSFIIGCFFGCHSLQSFIGYCLMAVLYGVHWWFLLELEVVLLSLLLWSWLLLMLIIIFSFCTCVQTMFSNDLWCFMLQCQPTDLSCLEVVMPFMHSLRSALVCTFHANLCMEKWPYPKECHACHDWQQNHHDYWWSYLLLNGCQQIFAQHHSMY